MTTTSITLKGDPQIFKVGATVGAYLRSNWPQGTLPPTGAPKGSSAASTTVASNGTITFTGLTAGAAYYAATDLDPGGSHDYHYMQFTVGDAGDLGGSSGGGGSGAQTDTANTFTEAQTIATVPGYEIVADADPAGWGWVIHNTADDEGVELLPGSAGVYANGLFSSLLEDYLQLPNTTDPAGPPAGSARAYVKAASGRSKVYLHDAGGPKGLLDTTDLDTDGTLAANSDSKVASQKAVKTYTDTVAALKANLASPTFTGTATIPTAAVTTLSGTPNFSGNATGQTQAQNDNSTKLATTAYVDRDRILRKTSDQTLTQSNTTLQNITDLSFSIAVSEHWAVDGYIIVQGASATADFKLGFTGPTGATATWGVPSPRGESVTTGGWSGVAPASTPVTLGTLSDTAPIGGAAAITGFPVVGVFVADGTHAGTIQFQASQNTSTAENNKILTDSYLRITKIA